MWFFRFPTQPEVLTISYSGLVNEATTINVDKIQRKIVLGNVNAEESSALFRLIFEFCPENTTVKISHVSSFQSIIVKTCEMKPKIKVKLKLDSEIDIEVLKSEKYWSNEDYKEKLMELRKIK